MPSRGQAEHHSSSFSTAAIIRCTVSLKCSPTSPYFACATSARAPLLSLPKRGALPGQAGRRDCFSLTHGACSETSCPSLSQEQGAEQGGRQLLLTENIYFENTRLEEESVKPLEIVYCYSTPRRSHTAPGSSSHGGTAQCLLQGLEEEAAGDLLPTFLSGGQRAAPSWHPPGQGAALTPPALPKCSSHGAGGTDGAAQHPGCSHRLMAQHQRSFPRGWFARASLVAGNFVGKKRSTQTATTCANPA